MTSDRPTDTCDGPPEPSYGRPESSTELVPPTVAGFAVEGLIGAGGQAVVWRAVSDDGSPVALKAWRHALSAKERDRFQREVSTLRLLRRHPHVVDLVDAAAPAADQAWLAMELCETSLADPGTVRALSADGRLRLADDVLSGLSAVHETARALHRDIKPSNILLQQGRAKLADLGLALRRGLHTSLGSAGTGAYTAPELVGNHQPSIASDIYAVGVVLYDLLDGLDLPGLDQLLTRACSVNPSDRPPSAQHLRGALVELRSSRNVVAPRVELADRPLPAVRHGEGARARLDARSGVNGAVRVDGQTTADDARDARRVFARPAAHDALAAYPGMIARFRQRREDIRRARSLLGLQRRGASIYRSDNTHPLYRTGQLHPDNRIALTAAAGHDYLAARSSGGLVVQDDVGGSLADNLVLIGSPTSEGVSQVVFGYEPRQADTEGLVMSAAPLDLPYRMVLDSNAITDGATASRFVPGRGLVTRPNWRIESDTELHIPTVRSDGLLETDFLLVTRVRNFLSAQAFDQGRFLMSLAGAHGTGTRAVELLLHDRTVLAAIGAATRDLPDISFQALFRVSGIVHDQSRGSHARRIELVGRVHILDDRPQRWDVARSVAQPRAQQWLTGHKPDPTTD